MHLGHNLDLYSAYNFENQIRTNATNFFKSEDEFI